MKKLAAMFISCLVALLIASIYILLAEATTIAVYTGNNFMEFTMVWTVMLVTVSIAESMTSGGVGEIILDIILTAIGALLLTSGVNFIAGNLINNVIYFAIAIVPTAFFASFYSLAAKTYIEHAIDDWVKAAEAPNEGKKD